MLRATWLILSPTIETVWAIHNHLKSARFSGDSTDPPDIRSPKCLRRARGAVRR
jgi:hypothetical protein